MIEVGSSESTGFPPADGDGCEPYQKIAEFAKCSEFDVLDAFGTIIPEWSKREHLAVVKQRAKSYNTAVAQCEDLVRTMREFPNEVTLDLVQAGAPTLPQLEHLVCVLRGDAQSLNEFAEARKSAGTRDPAAYDVSEGVRRLFRALRRPITFGQSWEGNEPSTEFGTTVQFALGAFGVFSDWRRPSEHAFRRQKEIQARLDRMRSSSRVSAERAQDKKASDVLDALGVTIQSEGEAPNIMMCIRISARPDIPEYRVPLDAFGSGRRLIAFAADWARQITNKTD